MERLRRENAELRSRLEFVEELVGPTEAQRKSFQQQLVAARAAALHARAVGATLPTKLVGRLDGSWLHARGLSERDGNLLQQGCMSWSSQEDISLLGDPTFRPYDQHLQPCWDARGGALRMALSDVRDRWGQDVALEVVRCAIELDRHDPSRRLGCELPWHADEEREMQPAEVIQALERELVLLRGIVDTEESSRLESSRSTPQPLLPGDEPDWSSADDIQQILNGKVGGPWRMLGDSPQGPLGATEEAVLELLEQEVAARLSPESPFPDM